jgi:hypothetical protein
METKTINRVFGIGFSLVIIFFTYLFFRGFVEIINNQSSAYIITFYVLVCVIIVWRLGESLKYSLSLIFKKKLKQEGGNSSQP